MESKQSESRSSMKIQKPHNPTATETIRKDLLLLLEQPSIDELPPCPSCDSNKNKDCSPKCGQAPTNLSNDPLNHPLEEKIVPLVYELSVMRLYQTCWSCEGHFNQQDQLWKVPQVCFYSTSPIYPQLLVKHTDNLSTQKRLSYPWRVVLSNLGQTHAVTYTIEPNLNHIDDPHLGKLQQDLAILAENLSNNIKQLAKEMLLELN